jgi:hypothetical protein
MFEKYFSRGAIRCGWSNAKEQRLSGNIYNRYQGPSALGSHEIVFNKTEPQPDWAVCSHPGAKDRQLISIKLISKI